jgi:hypothetical protein
MTDVLVQFDEPVVGRDGVPYTARVCGREVDGGQWEGWLEFLPRAEGDPQRTGRETTQPNRGDLGYWATGLSRVYLEGALDRALHPVMISGPSVLDLEPLFSGPADSRERSVVETAPRTVLDPFAVYAQGEAILRQELSALSADHLRNIISAYALSPLRRGGNPRSEAELVTQIVSAVRERRAG